MHHWGRTLSVGEGTGSGCGLGSANTTFHEYMCIALGRVCRHWFPPPPLYESFPPRTPRLYESFPQPPPPTAAAVHVQQLVMPAIPTTKARVLRAPAARGAVAHVGGVVLLVASAALLRVMAGRTAHRATASATTVVAAAALVPPPLRVILVLLVPGAAAAAGAPVALIPTTAAAIAASLVRATSSRVCVGVGGRALVTENTE
jgi:hypothetical protein